MKKFYVSLTFLLLCISSFAQGYIVTVDGDIRNGGCGNTSGVRRIDLIYTDGSTDLIWEGLRTAHVKWGPHVINSDSSKDIKEILVYSVRKIESGFPKICESSGRDTFDRTPITNRGCFSARKNKAYDGVTEGWYQVDIKPIVTVTPEPDDDSGIGYDSDKYRLPATPGFDPDAYGWQYQLTHSGNRTVDSAWKAIDTDNAEPHVAKFNPQYYFEKDNWPDFVDYNNWKVDFRSVQCGVVFTVPDTRSIKYSAPRFGSHSPIIPRVGCFGASDASITFKVNRQFRPGEKLALKILDLDDEPKGIDPRASVGGLKEVIIKADYTFTVDSLRASIGPKGFQAVFFSGSKLFTGDADHVRDFKVGSPEKVTFEITDQTNVNCNGGENGTISLAAKGGEVNGTYQYVIYEGSIPKSIPDQKWENFLNKNTHVIDRRKKGIYNIAVRDANECLAEIWEFNTEEGRYDNKGLVKTVVEIKQPAAPLNVNLLKVTPDREQNSNKPRAFGFIDGRIYAVITGGTGPYTLNWEKDNAAIGDTSSKNISGSNIDGDYTVQAILNDLGKGN